MINFIDYENRRVAEIVFGGTILVGSVINEDSTTSIILQESKMKCDIDYNPTEEEGKALTLFANTDKPAIDMIFHNKHELEVFIGRLEAIKDKL